MDVLLSINEPLVAMKRAFNDGNTSALLCFRQLPTFRIVVTGRNKLRGKLNFKLLVCAFAYFAVFLTCSFLNWWVLHNFLMSLRSLANTPFACLGPPEETSSSASTSRPSMSGLELGAEPFSRTGGDDRGTLPTWNKRDRCEIISKLAKLSCYSK